jgi:hypothetical protein
MMLEERPPSRRDRERARRTEATRRWRQRAARGEAVAPVDVDGEMIDFLVHDALCLAESDADDMTKVGAAIRRYVKSEQSKAQKSRDP